MARLIDRRWPGPRAAVSVRTRYLDDAIRRQCADGLDQLVILGAGFDTRAPTGCRACGACASSRSTTRRRRPGSARPWAAGAGVTYVPVDFLRTRVEDALAAAGCAPGRSTLFLWEGVTSYLDAAAVDATLRTIARLGRRLLYHVCGPRATRRHGRARGRRAIARARARAGRALYASGLAPAELGRYLDERGLDLLEDLSLAEAAGLYYGARRPPVSAYYHVVRARCRA